MQKAQVFVQYCVYHQSIAVSDGYIRTKAQIKKHVPIRYLGYNDGNNEYWTHPSKKHLVHYPLFLYNLLGEG